jgi:tetratricopeptide (TPR) repeat protein
MSGEFLDPLPLRPDPPPDPGHSNTGPWRMVAIAAALLALGLGLIAWLGRQVGTEPPHARPTPTPTVAPQPTATPDPAARLAAEAALDTMMAALRPLREKKAELWGGAAWTNAVAAIATGDEALARKNYALAQSSYAAASAALERVAGESAAAPGRLMSQAEADYAAGDATKSVAALEAVLLLSPGHAAASTLLPRARRADQTFASLQSARQKVQASELAQAWVDLERAEKSDAAFPGLAGLRKEVSNALSELEFTRWISEGLQALSAGDVDAAEPMIRRAAAFKPGHPAVADALAQLEDALRQRKVLALRAEAERLEKEGAWRQAHERYLDILSLDPAAPFSLAGRERTQTWLVWEERIDSTLKALKSTAAADLDRDLAAQELTAWPAALRKRAETFRERFHLEHAPVPVTFRSDAETTVQIVQVARWEPFIEKMEKLKPGTYVAKGNRLGYRDVRVTFTVPPGGPGGVVDVRCVEGIH